MRGLRIFARLLPVIGLLWIYLFLRWHDIAEHMPYFIDEIHHVRRARAVYAFNDLHTSTTPGKFLLYYWLGLFHLPEFPDLWLVRAPVALTTILGGASTFALARLLFDRRVALLALAVVSFFPFLLFYERLSLTDPLAGTMTTLVAWFSVIVARYPSKGRAMILATIFCLMWAAKIVTFPMIVIPFLAVGLLGPRPISLNKPLRQQIERIWQDYRPYIMRASLIIIVVWGILIGFYQTRKFIDPNTRAIVDDYLYGGATSGGSVIDTSLERVGDALWYLWGPLLIGLALVAGVYLWRRQWRLALFLIGSILLFWAVIVLVAGQLNSRYLSIVGNLCAIAIAGGLVMLTDDIRVPLVRWVPVSLLVIWIFAFGLPFARTAIQDPVALELPPRDQSEYFRNYTGFALPEALSYMVNEGSVTPDSDVSVVVTSFVRVCEFLPYHMPVDMHDDLNLICEPPYVGRFENRYAILNEALALYERIYVMVEQHETSDGSIVFDEALIDGTVEGRVAVFERPHAGVSVEVYIVNNSTQQ